MTISNFLIERQVFLTLAYSAQFGQALTIEEIGSRLLTPTSADFDFSPYYLYRQLEQALDRLERVGLVEKQGDRYFLAGQQKQTLLNPQLKSQAASKLSQAKVVTRLLKFWPWIEAIGLSGSVGAGMANQDDDLDFLIITRPDSLWMSRLFVTAVAWLFGRRRSWSKEEPNSWCFNIWMESDNLKLEKRRRNIYTAYELLQLKPLYGLTAFWWLWRENSWVGNKLLLARWLAPARPPQIAWLEFTKHILLYSFQPLTWPINQLAYWLQRWYMRAHQTKEQVSLHRAFFHPRDTKHQLYTNWQRSIERTIEFAST